MRPTWSRRSGCGRSCQSMPTQTSRSGRSCSCRSRTPPGRPDLVEVGWQSAPRLGRAGVRDRGRSGGPGCRAGGWHRGGARAHRSRQPALPARGGPARHAGRGRDRPLVRAVPAPVPEGARGTGAIGRRARGTGAVGPVSPSVRESWSSSRRVVEDHAERRPLPARDRRTPWRMPTRWYPFLPRFGASRSGRSRTPPGRASARARGSARAAAARAVRTPRRRNRAGAREDRQHLEREEHLAVEVLMKRVPVARAVAEDQRRRPILTGGVASAAAPRARAGRSGCRRAAAPPSGWRSAPGAGRTTRAARRSCPAADGRSSGSGRPRTGSGPSRSSSGSGRCRTGPRAHRTRPGPARGRDRVAWSSSSERSCTRGARLRAFYWWRMSVAASIVVVIGYSAASVDGRTALERRAPRSREIAKPRGARRPCERRVRHAACTRGRRGPR